ncbi:hypothetical protein A9Q81_09975 [Gammaproteobacteria bacterium 42_54_T18]|nr:hypothetical protein A9Q81_09975 [Gammaproteobacteria bacterium 42_54_T18]
MCQGLIFLLYYVVCSHLHCNTYRELGLFYVKLWDSSDINTIIDSYDETGSFYALSLSEQREESLATAFGVKSAYVLNTKKAVYIPSLEVEWVHQYNEDARTIEATFAQSPSSGSFSIETQKSDRDYLNAAFSVSAMFSGGKSAFFRYDTLLGEDDRTSESYTLGGRYEF